MVYSPEFLARIADGIGLTMGEIVDQVGAMRFQSEALRKEIGAREGWCDPRNASVEVAATVPGNEAKAAHVLRLEALITFYNDILLTESSRVAAEARPGNLDLIRARAARRAAE